MLLLALDTATDRGSLALLEDDRLVGERHLDTPGAFLVHLLPSLDALLAEAGRTLPEVEAVCVSQGPGNFTGLRLGLATAQGLALALAIPAVPVPTLEVLAAACGRSPHPVAAIADAKRQEVYLGLFDCRGEFPVPLAEPERLAAAGLPERLAPPVLLTGPGLGPHKDYLADRLAPGVVLAPEEKWYPQAAMVGRLGRRRLAQGLAVAPPQLIPLYLRPAL
uniref:tRNA (Adenosine(37)-N6)-threonylcarbamoyltransferase complex dimerization subunit type 1 TsaB n=1 Tax=Desulfobacca acetoxidans TaxID=60893 RepID=A0A7C3UW64_9BACT